MPDTIIIACGTALGALIFMTLVSAAFIAIIRGVNDDE